MFIQFPFKFVTSFWENLDNILFENTHSKTTFQHIRFTWSTTTNCKSLRWRSALRCLKKKESFETLPDNTKLVKACIKFWLCKYMYCDDEFAVFLDRNFNSFRISPLLDILYAGYKWSSKPKTEASSTREALRKNAAC